MKKIKLHVKPLTTRRKKIKSSSLSSLLLVNFNRSSWSFREAVPSGSSPWSSPPLPTTSSELAISLKPSSLRRSNNSNPPELSMSTTVRGAHWRLRTPTRRQKMIAWDANPCDRRFLILISTGRSASTTLTWMLDSLPGVRMSGENNNLMGHLYDLYEGTLKTLIKKNPERVSVDPWFRNPLTKSSLACAFQNIVETITPPLPIDPMLSPSSMEEKRKEEREMIIGFKTVRFFNEGRSSVEEASKLVNYIVEMFPCTRFVVNVRSDVESQVLSQQKAWNNIGTDELGTQKRENVILERIARDILGPDRAIFLDSSEWTKNVTVLNKAVEWLGFSRECFFTELMQFNTGGDRGYGSTKKTLTPHGPGCRYLGGKGN